MCLIGHLNNCNVAFRVYVHVYYTNRVIEFSLNFPGLKKTFLILIKVSKSCSITFSDIIEQILCTNKKKKNTGSQLYHPNIYNRKTPCLKTTTLDPGP